LIDGNGIGVLLDEFSDEAYITAIKAAAALADVNSKCRATAHTEFDLTTVGGVRYRGVYSRLLGEKN